MNKSKNYKFSLKMSVNQDGNNNVNNVNNVIYDLPVSFSEKLTLLEKYKNTHNIKELVNLIKNKPVQTFTETQLEAIRILSEFDQKSANI